LSIIDRLIKVTKSKNVNTVEKSVFFSRTPDMVSTKIPMINVALSGSLTGGLCGGMLTIAGKSKHFKTMYGLFLVSEYLKKHEDSVCVFFDNEFGSPNEYFEKYGIDTSRVIHVPFSTVEELKHKVVSQLDLLEDEDSAKVIFMIDSIGNAASEKEISDARDGENKVDMTRAKQIKSLFRIITAKVKMLDLPFLVINHTYDTQTFISTEKMSGGTGIEYNSDNIWFIGRKQTKDSGEVIGYKFSINVYKSRKVREKTNIPIEVTWEDGIRPYSGLDEISVELGVCDYGRIGRSKSIKFKEREILVKDSSFDDEFWKYVIQNSNLSELIEKKYKM